MNTLKVEDICPSQRVSCSQQVTNNGLFASCCGIVVYERVEWHDALH